MIEAKIGITVEELENHDEVILFVIGTCNTNNSHRLNQKFF